MNEAMFLASAVEQAHQMAQKEGQVAKADPAYEKLYATDKMPKVEEKIESPNSPNSLDDVIRMSVIVNGKEYYSFPLAVDKNGNFELTLRIKTK